MISTLTQTKAAPTPRVNVTVASTPGAHRIRKAYHEAQDAAHHAVDKALICGQLMLEQRDALVGKNHNQHTEAEGKFTFWLERTISEIPLRTAQRWMQLAERVAAACGIQAGLGSNGETLSMALSAPEQELTPKTRQWRQTVFDFTAGKTMKECLAGVVVEGNEAHSITRSHNGRTKGGAGGNRKNFVGFTAVKLRHISTFLSQKLSPSEQAKICASFGSAIEKWPRWLLKTMAENVRDELKLSDEERSARGNKS